jgi:polysaccharide export outer membrane protein
MTVETAVAIAGGYSERANERKVQISRRINGSIERMLVPPDTVVMPGDTIYVRERFF